MQLKLSALTTVALASMAAAQSVCSTGPIQCCNSVEKASGPTASKLLGLLGVVVDDLNVLVGITCTPIDLISGGNSCTGQTVCCQNNHFSGVIAIGCTPINVVL